MADPSEPLLILTNDDGIDAPGIMALRQAVEGLGRCRIIAPAGNMSNCGHQATTHGGIAFREVDENRIAVGGTPVDCVRLAIHSLASDLRWVLSGINAGGNLGTDAFISGTVAAAREAAIRGFPAIAVSHYIAKGRPIDWPVAVRRAAKALRLLMERPHEPGTFWNVNLPHPPPSDPEPEIVFCPLDLSPLPLDYRIENGIATYSSVYQSRLRNAGQDVAVCFGGQITVTRMSLFECPNQL